MDYHALAVEIVDTFAWKVALACFVLWLLLHIDQQMRASADAKRFNENLERMREADKRERQRNPFERPGEK
jgi:hypothetical protein